MKKIMKLFYRRALIRRFGYEVYMPSNNPHIFLIGVDHCCQYSTKISRLNLPFSQGGPDRENTYDQFGNFLHEVANKISVDLICEEMSEEALNERGDLPKSIAKTIANEIGCKHIFADPSRKEREEIYSDDIFNNIDFDDDTLNIYGTNFPIDQNYIEDGQEIRLWKSEYDLKKIYRREIFWVQKIIDSLKNNNIIFICGANHVPTFKRILNSRGFVASVVTSDFSEKLINEYASSRVYDPSIIGPFNICFGCHEEKDPNYTFCLNCGRRSGDFLVYEEIKNFNCVAHSDVAAIAFCSSCADPKCAECFASNDRGFNISGMCETRYCSSCTNLMEAASSKFIKENSDNRFCTYHRKISSKSSCKSCETSLCESCTYYITNGNKKKLINGPFCLTCFRTHTLYGNRKSWTSPALPSFKNLAPTKIKK